MKKIMFLAVTLVCLGWIVNCSPKSDTGQANDTMMGIPQALQ